MLEVFFCVFWFLFLLIGILLILDLDWSDFTPSYQRACKIWNQSKTIRVFLRDSFASDMMEFGKLKRITSYSKRYAVEFRPSAGLPRFVKKVRDIADCDIPNGFIRRETKTKVTSTETAQKLYELYNTNGRIVFHDCLHWSQIYNPYDVTKPQLCIITWTIFGLLQSSNIPFWRYLIDFGLLYIIVHVPELWKYSKECEIKRSIRSFGFADEERLAELCEIHDYNQFKILKELFKE